MKEFKVRAETTSEILGQIKQVIRPGKTYRVTVVEHKKRSLDANAQMHVWCKIISQDTGEDIKTVTMRNKKDFGLPILLANGSERAVVVSWMLNRCGYHQMDDSQQLKLVSALEVTRTFNTAEHNELRDNMQAFWNSQGIVLPYMS